MSPNDYFTSTALPPAPPSPAPTSTAASHATHHVPHVPHHALQLAGVHVGHLLHHAHHRLRAADLLQHPRVHGPGQLLHDLVRVARQLRT